MKSERAIVCANFPKRFRGFSAHVRLVSAVKYFRPAVHNSWVLLTMYRLNYNSEENDEVATRNRKSSLVKYSFDRDDCDVDKWIEQKKLNEKRNLYFFFSKMLFPSTFLIDSMCTTCVRNNKCLWFSVRSLYILCDDIEVLKLNCTSVIENSYRICIANTLRSFNG